MNATFEKFLENKIFDEELKNALKEAWEEKVNETKKELELQIRKELGQRYEFDKKEMVEAMENFLVDSLKQEMKKIKENNDSLVNDLKKEIEEVKNIKEMLKNKENVLNEFKNLMFKKFTNFAKKKLGEEIMELRNDMKNFNEQKQKMKQDVRNIREEYRKAYEKRIKVLENFVVNQLTEELKEFNADRKKLEERRVELELKAKEKIAETQKLFISKASKLIENIVEKEMRKELQQLKEDIKVARENDFGRRIFEAFACEFMGSYLMEGSQLKRLSDKLKETDKHLNSLKEKLEEKNLQLMKMKKDTEMLKESLNREKTINELLAPLSGKHRKIMKNLLEDVKTEKLQDYFKKFLPQVLNEQNDIKNIAKTIVNEDFYVNSIEGDKIIVTGDKEKKNEENSFSLSEVIELRKLAGINR